MWCKPRVLDDLQTMGWDLPVIEPAKQSEVKRNPIFSAADLLRQHFAGGYATLYGHEGDVQAVEFTPDGKYLVSAGTDGSVRIWDAVTGLQVRPGRQQRSKSRRWPLAPMAKRWSRPSGSRYATQGASKERPGEPMEYWGRQPGESLRDAGCERSVHTEGEIDDSKKGSSGHVR